LHIVWPLTIKAQSPLQASTTRRLAQSFDDTSLSARFALV